MLMVFSRDGDEWAPKVSLGPMSSHHPGPPCAGGSLFLPRAHSLVSWALILCSPPLLPTPPFRKQPFLPDRMRSLQAPGCCHSFFKDHAHANTRSKARNRRGDRLTKRRERKKPTSRSEGTDI